MNNETQHVVDMQREYHDAIFKKFREGEARMDAMSSRIDENTAMTQALKNDTGELLQILHVGKSGLKVLGWLGAGAKWVAAIATAAVAMWGLWHGKGS
jgi:hypothetical protein